jgi:hypothetical protein
MVPENAQVKTEPLQIGGLKREMKDKEMAMAE